jgi:molybdate/tungstate transport system ATP-binding protein
MVKVENLHIEFDSFSLKDIYFHVKKGEYFMLLGASGAGKSVVLESIAGLIQIKKGNILLNDKNITSTAIQKRKIGLVFQDFALFPHLSVKENICYPLKIRKTAKPAIEEKLKALSCELNIDHLLDRKIETLSGGEKQRVALARTLTLEPEVLLLDEPLSSMDVGLKGELRRILRRLNKQGQTIIHVTHDYEEAISLASRIAIMHEGTLIQSGTPKEVFTHPKNKFVANFGGIKNFYEAKLEENTQKETIKAIITENISFTILTKLKAKTGSVLIGQKNIIISTDKHPTSSINQFKGIIQEIIPARLGYELLIDCGILFYVAITTDTFNELNYKEEQMVWVAFNPSAVKFIPG